MPTRSIKVKSAPRRGTEHDCTVVARRVVDQAIGEQLDGSPLPNPDEGKNPAAVAFRKLGGAKGRMARAAKLSADRRREIAKKAALARPGVTVSVETVLFQTDAPDIVLRRDKVGAT